MLAVDPVAGVAAIVNVVGEPTDGVAEAVIVTVGRGCWPTTMDALPVTTSPKLSTPVTTTTNDPAFRNWCEMAVGCPLNVCGEEPSPQSTVIRVMGVAVPAAP